MESLTLRHNGPDDRSRGTALRIPVRPEYVARARGAVEAAARRAGLDAERVDDLLVAVSEACTNAMEAQLATGTRDPIEVTCTETERYLEVVVADRGGGFDPSALVARPPLTHPGHLDLERGWGVQLMRALVDEVVFDITGNRTQVHLRVARVGGRG